MLGKELISIVVCTYNGEKFLVQQLESLVNQSYLNFEIIIVDDKSSDTTWNILDEYSKNFPFIFIYQNEQNLGYIKNFEKAISLSTGHFIALCDQDDIWSENKLQILIENIGDNKLIYHDSEFINQQGDSLDKNMSDIMNMYQGDSFKPFLFSNSVSGHACLFTREFVTYSMPFPDEIFHDCWLAFTATNLGKIKFLDLPLVKYRQHENSDTNILNLERTRNRDGIHSKQKIEKKIKELQIFAGYKFNKDPRFLIRLARLYETRLNSYLALKLVLFMYKHFRLLFLISKKGTLSKLNFVFKQIWGVKFKS